MMRNYVSGSTQDPLLSRDDVDDVSLSCTEYRFDETGSIALI